jgi:hypothetical protein
VCGYCDKEHNLKGCLFVEEVPARAVGVLLRGGGVQSNLYLTKTVSKQLKDRMAFSFPPVINNCIGALPDTAVQQRLNSIRQFF